MSMRNPITRHQAVLCLVLLAMIATWSVGCGGGDNPTTGEARIVSAAELSDAASEAATPIYWLGERGGTELELTEEDSGRVYVRYPEEGAEAGDEPNRVLTVATYPSPDGVAELRRAARNGRGTVVARTDDGAVLLVDPGSPNSAHLAYPDGGPQIEVYSPRPGQALRLASRGAVRPVP
jgi:hypothetical protein